MTFSVVSAILVLLLNIQPVPIQQVLGKFEKIIMLAVIATGGKQYVVKSGDVLKIEKLDVKEGDKVTFDQVLLTADEDGGNVKLGTPVVSGASVSATVLKQGKYRTVRVEKFKRKVRYHKVHGQRQRYTEVKIA